MLRLRSGTQPSSSEAMPSCSPSCGATVGGLRSSLVGIGRSSAENRGEAQTSSSNVAPSGSSASVASSSHSSSSQLLAKRPAFGAYFVEIGGLATGRDQLAVAQPRPDHLEAGHGVAPDCGVNRRELAVSDAEGFRAGGRSGIQRDTRPGTRIWCIWPLPAGPSRRCADVGGARRDRRLGQISLGL